MYCGRYLCKGIEATKTKWGERMEVEKRGSRKASKRSWLWSWVLKLRRFYQEDGSKSMWAGKTAQCTSNQPSLECVVQGTISWRALLIMLGNSKCILSRPLLILVGPRAVSCWSPSPPISSPATQKSLHTGWTSQPACPGCVPASWKHLLLAPLRL